LRRCSPETLQKKEKKKAGGERVSNNKKKKRKRSKIGVSKPGLLSEGIGGGEGRNTPFSTPTAAGKKKHNKGGGKH